MARDPGLEEMVGNDLDEVQGLQTKAMFGGWAWLMRGHLLCGAREDGMLARVGKEKEAWALTLPGVTSMISRGRKMGGWVRADAGASGNDATRRSLLEAAIAFNRTLPAK